MIYALDTNVILYAEGVNDELRRNIATQLILKMGAPDLVLPIQVIGEVASGLVKRKRLAKTEAAAVAQRWLSGSRTQATTAEIMEQALQLSAQHHFQIWDAVIISASAKAGVETLFSEDMQSGFSWNGLTIVNPFQGAPTTS
jgi:predicted nucleic acid-binding protein